MRDYNQSVAMLSFRARRGARVTKESPSIGRDGILARYSNSSTIL
jgi:hypothetical protein